MQQTGIQLLANKRKQANTSRAQSLWFGVLRILLLIDTVEGWMLRSERSFSKTNSFTIANHNSLAKGKTSFSPKGFKEITKISSTCFMAERQLDSCSAMLISMSNQGIVYPSNMDEMDSNYCPKFRNTVACIKNATDCYKPFERQIINWLLTSTRKINYKRCKSEPEKKKFLKLTNFCLATMKRSMDRCMRNYIASLDAILSPDHGFFERSSEEDVQIQLSCCANFQFKQCMMDEAKQQCKPTSSLSSSASGSQAGKLKKTSSLSSSKAAQKLAQKESDEMIGDLRKTLDAMALTGPEIVCNSVDTDFCRARFDGRFDGKVSYKSIVPLMLRIYANK